MLPGSPDDLSAEGNHLSAIAQAAVSAGSQPTPVASIFSEHCPACNVEVPLQDITTAVCSNGHTWGVLPIFGHYLRAAISFVHSYSSLLNHDFHPVNSTGPHVHWL